jgi:hypothetical protein
MFVCPSAFFEKQLFVWWILEAAFLVAAKSSACLFTLLLGCAINWLLS